MTVYRLKNPHVFPIIKEYNLRQDVTEIDISNDFESLHRALFSWIVLDTITASWLEFTDSIPLTNGIQFNYRTINLLPTPIKRNFDFKRYMYDFEFVADTKGGSPNILGNGRFTFLELMTRGIRLKESNDIFLIQIQDDMSAIADEICLVLEGH